MQRWVGAVLGAAFGAFAAAAAAAAATSIAASPQGEVAQVRQVSVRFSQAVVAFGDPRLADPFAIACQGAVARRQRALDQRPDLGSTILREALPPGARCTARLRPQWRPAAGGAAAAFDRRDRVLVLDRRPGGRRGRAVCRAARSRKTQHFLLRLNGAAVAASVPGNAWCEAEGIGERLPLAIVDGAARERVLKARRIKPADAGRALLVRCARPLPNGAALRLVWGRGIAAAANPRLVTTIEQRFRYQVRAAFTAEFSCERERANAPCLPIRPMALRFSAPVARTLAAPVRLVPAAGAGPALAPVFDKDDKAPQVSEIAFPTPLRRERRLTDRTCRASSEDNAGRALANAASFPLPVATGEAPPIAKFAAAPFGIIERDGEAALPVTLRHVQGDLRPAAAAGRCASSGWPATPTSSPGTRSCSATTRRR